MGKGSGDDCRGAMTLDAATPAPAKPVRGAKLLPLARLEQLMHARPARRGDDVGPVPSREQWSAVHEFSYAGLHIEEYDEFEFVLPDGTRHSTRGDSMYERYQYDGRIVTDDGRQAGVVRRFLEQDSDGRLAAELYRLRLEPEFQGRGFGPAYHDHLEQRYRQLGVDRMTCSPVEMGAYTWACRDGWLFDPTRSSVWEVKDIWGRITADDPRLADPHFLSACAATVLWQRRESLLDFAWGRGEIDGDTYHAFRRRFATPRELETGRYKNKICTPQEIANFGRDKPFTDPDGNRTWPGKHLLMGLISDRHRQPDNTACTWSAVKFL